MRQVEYEFEREEDNTDRGRECKVRTEVWQATDNRGEKHEAYIVANDLEIYNALGELHTFAGVTGAVTEMNLDITIGKKGIYVDD